MQGSAAQQTDRSGGWTIPLLFAGVGLIACCLLIPQIDSNRRKLWEIKKLKLDLEQIQKQTAANEQFVKRISEDPALAERLAQRQMKLIREGTKVVDLPGQMGAGEMHPFALVAVDPPPELPPYEPVGGKLASLCRSPRTRLYVMAGGLMLMAFGLILGYGPRRA
jgi:hypothetical protein